MLGCVAAGMGIALVPQPVLAGFAQQQHLSTHRLPKGADRMLIELVWRQGARSPKIDALLDLLKPPAQARAQRT